MKRAIIQNTVTERALALNEAEGLVVISENLFTSKMEILKRQYDSAPDDKEKKHIETEAKIAYENYKKSLHDIENFVQDVCVDERK